MNSKLLDSFRWKISQYSSAKNPPESIQCPKWIIRPAGRGDRCILLSQIIRSFAIQSREIGGLSKVSW